MSSKIVTWGEIIKRRHQNKLENRETDTMNKGEKKLALDSTNDNNQTFIENNTSVNNLRETNDCGNSSISTPDLLDTGVGHTIVCQVLPSLSAADMY